MGSYAELTVAGYPLISSRDAVIPEVMTVFRETDRHVFIRRLTERNVLVWGEPDDPSDDEMETVVEYSSETRNVIDRLNVMGFTLRRVREEFEIGRCSELKKFESWAEEDDDSQWFAENWNFLKRLTFDDYARAFAKVITDGLVPFDDHKKKELDPVIKYILGENDEYLFGFLGGDIRLLLRLACELVAENTRVVQDITELVSSGYYGEDEPVCENAISRLTAGHPENSSRIVLTEGSTDGAILREALALLYPHLSGYYSFPDFDSSRSPGGAGHLVSLVKAFSAAKITNRIIALFDNDTAAREAMRALETISLPPNIVARHYPELELLRAYPTLGPGGLTLLDVNGLAASIELYFGKDVLLDSAGTLTPVQWRGYSETLKHYQGEVMRKTQLRTAFHQKAARCRADPEVLKASDWSGLSVILQEIFQAFD